MGKAGAEGGGGEAKEGKGRGKGEETEWDQAWMRAEARTADRW